MQRGMVRSRVLAGLLSVLVIGSMLVPVAGVAGPQRVMASCIPNRLPDGTARYVGVIQTGVSSLSGVAANIEQYDPYYTGRNTTGTNATLMVLQGGNWVQLGWFKSKIRYGTTRRESGVEVQDSSGGYFLWYPARPVGELTPYEILAEAGGQWNLFINGAYVDTVSDSFTGNEAQFFGETHSKADQMPGGSGNRVVFQNMVYHTGAGHTPHWVTADFGTDWPAFYGFANPSDANGQIWDKECTS